MTVSHWRRAAASPRTIERDLCIVGAGVAGVGAAIWAGRAGASCCILERHTLASGASSRNAGFLMRGAADHYADAIRLYGRERARLVWKWSEDNLALLRAEGIESLPSYRRVPSCLLALTPAQEAELRESHELLQDDGFEVGWQDGGTDTLWSAPGARNRVRGALVNPNDASINPVEMMRLLASRLAEPVHENQEVYGISPCESPGAAGASERVEVRTSDLIVRARHVLLCTNAYAGLLSPALGALVTPRRGQMMAIRGPDLRLDASYYANHGSEYLRQTADGTVVVGGCRTYFASREIGYEDTTTPYVQNAIEEFARMLLGDRWSIQARWSGTMGFSPDGLPLVGPVLDLDGAGRVWFCGGFTGHGMSLGFNTARSAVQALLTGQACPFDLSRTS